MRYNEILESYSDVSLDQTDNMLDQYKSEIDECIILGPRIFRGMRFTTQIVIGDSEHMIRKASGTKNTINSLTTILPSWEGWPKREKSFICTNSPSTANYYSSTYGNAAVYVVIPLQTNAIAVCNYSDFWTSVPNFESSLYMSLPSFNSLLDIMVETAETIFNSKFRYYDSNPTLLLNTIDQLVEKYKSDPKRVMDEITPMIRTDRSGHLNNIKYIL
jgi:hypothetical protein